jgi:hypothetical protein
LIVDYTPKTGILAITQELADVSVGQGDPVTFTLGAKGAPPLKYQWYGHAGTVKLPELWKLRWHKGYEPAQIKLP